VKPLILALDTTHEFGSLALARGAGILEERALHSPSGFAQVIYPELESLLAGHGLKPPEIDCFAAASGPGSFTGVRVGLACAKGLAEATAKPVVAVSNLEALACFGSAELRAVVMDARRGDVYAAVYDANRQLVEPELVLKLEFWLQTLPDTNLEFISTDFEAFEQHLAGTRFEKVRRVLAPRALAPAVAAIAFERYLRGEVKDPAAIDANYVRRSDAELFWKE
jgi:tRNA threonylcarbamoyladenosine biosynthesis protein TsaB